MLRRNTPNFTVVIPTRERCDTLTQALPTVLAQDYPRLSVVVADNMSCDGTEELVRRLGDSRIRYVRSQRRLSMSSNWERALEEIDEGWVTILGDDDGLLPGALDKVVAIAESTGARAIRTRNCEYLWPSLRKSLYGAVYVPPQGSLKMIEGSACLVDVLEGRRHYTSLPVLYNGGFVHSSLLHELKARTGAFIRSMTPDVYLGVALAQIAGAFALCDFSVAVNGASAHSNGTSFFRNSGEAFSKYSQEENIPPHPAMAAAHVSACPRSLQFLVLEAYMQSMALGLPFHRAADPCRQLPLIQLDALTNRDDSASWKRDFMSLHRLREFDGAPAIWLRARARVQRIRTALRLRRARRVIGSVAAPLATIDQAVATASSIISDSSRSRFFTWQ